MEEQATSGPGKERRDIFRHHLITAVLSSLQKTLTTSAKTCLLLNATEVKEQLHMMEMHTLQEIQKKRDKGTRCGSNKMNPLREQSVSLLHKKY